MSYMNFKDFLLKTETQAVADKPIKQLGGGSPNDNDGFNNDGNNDDDEQWEWDNLKRFDSALIEWANKSPFAIKIKNAIFTEIFKQQPALDIKEYLPDDESNEYEFEFAPTGHIVLSAEWKLPKESIEDRLAVTLKMSKSDLWRPLEVQPNEIWSTLDKGDVFDYVFFHLNNAMLGQNVQYSNQYYDPSRPEGSRFDPQYFALQRNWEKDKATFEKYTKFVLFEKSQELEQFAKEYFPFEVELEKQKESVRALLWQDNYDASAYIWYRYAKV